MGRIIIVLIEFVIWFAVVYFMYRWLFTTHQPTTKELQNRRDELVKKRTELQIKEATVEIEKELVKLDEELARLDSELNEQ
jgi:hypothetical protein